MKKNETTIVNGNLRGTVLWFNPTRGYGFIQSDDGNNFFVHQNNINMEGFRSLDAGDVVEFKTESGGGEKPDKAVDVSTILSVKKIRSKLWKEGYEMSKYKVPRYSVSNTVIYDEGWMITRNGILESGENYPLSLEDVAKWIEE